MSPLVQPAPAAPKVSVACAWYNRADYIRDTIDSLLAQDFDSFEVVVVNDGSSDPRVRDILDSYQDPRLRVIHQANAGFTLAMRRAVDESLGSYIAVLGSGDVCYPARLQVQAAALDAHPEWVGVAVARENVQVGGPNDGRRNAVVPPMQYVDHTALLNDISNPISHGEMMYRRDVYLQIGGYRPIFRFSQDTDLWLRMTRHGAIGMLKDVLYQRRIFASDGIKGQVDKTLAQIRYAQMAKSCAREFDANGVDIVDLFGPNAVLFRKPDTLSSNTTAKAALKYLRNGMPEEARLLAGLAWREKPGFYPALSCLLTALGWTSVVKALLARLPIQDDSETRPLLRRL